MTHRLPISNRGFTLRELLVVLLLATVAAAAVAPAVDAARERDRRARCASNLRQTGQAIQMYANENKGNFPRTRFNPRNSSRVALFTNWDAKDPFGEDGPQSNDVTAAVFLLLRTQDITAETMLCPGDTAARPIHFGPAAVEGDAGEGVVDPVSTLDPPPDEDYRGRPATRPTTRPGREIPGWPPKPVGPPVAESVQDISNFPAPINLSYSYINPYPSQPAMDAGWKLNYTLASDFAVAADLNPGGPTVAKAQPKQMPTTAAVRAGAVKFSESMRKANSPNHGGFGQNVLYADGRVEWQPTPFCGMPRDNPRARDNVYTRWVGAGRGPDEDRAADPIVGPVMDPLDSVLLPTAASRNAAGARER